MIMYKDILSKYNQAILHMRERYKTKRFGLVFGAGVSMQLGFPSWNTLLERIASSLPEKDAKKCSKGTANPSFAQYLFQAFLNVHGDSHKKYSEFQPLVSAKIKSAWIDHVKNALYEGIPEKIEDIKAKAEYINDLLPIIENSKLTVNYNFDDSIQFLLQNARDKHKKDCGNQHRTDWRTDPLIWEQYSTIYHPNGYLPKNTGEKPSDGIVLLDDSFGDQLIQSMTGRFTYLSNHYAQNTCLLVGLSLEDPTLQNILRRNTIIHSGHIHYYIKFLDKGNQLSDSEKLIIKNSNFETYNLVTLFLDKNEISILAKLIYMSDNEFKELCDSLGARNKYVYYLTGCVAVGKSTTISYFRDLSIHDEWLDKMPAAMNSDPSFVNPDEIKEIDNFVAEQWTEKNRLLIEANGVILVDRCPLDALGFTKFEDWNKKAAFLYDKLSNHNPDFKIQDGLIIFLTAPPQELNVRAISGLRDTDEDRLKEQQDLLRRCYSEHQGIINLDCHGLTRGEVAKKVAWIIHMDEYKAFNIKSYLEKVKDAKYP